MEVNLTGIGPLGYLLVHALAALVFGFITWRNVMGAATNFEKGDENIAIGYLIISIVMALIGLVNVIFVFVIMGNLVADAL